MPKVASQSRRLQTGQLKGKGHDGKKTFRGKPAKVMKPLDRGNAHETHKIDPVQQFDVQKAVADDKRIRPQQVFEDYKTPSTKATKSKKKK